MNKFNDFCKSKDPQSERNKFILELCELCCVSYSCAVKWVRGEREVPEPYRRKIEDKYKQKFWNKKQVLMTDLLE